MDLDTGAVVAAEIHAADQGDTATLPGTLARRPSTWPRSMPRRRRRPRPSWSPTKATTRATR